MDERQRPSRRLLVTCLLVAGLGTLAVLLVHGGSQVGRELTLPVWALTVAMACGEASVIHLPQRRHSLAVSFTPVALVAGLAFASGPWFVPAAAAGVAAVLAFKRQSPTKKLFNIANAALDVAVAQAVFHLLDGAPDAATWRTSLALYAAVLVGAAVSLGALTAVMALATRSLSLAAARRVIVTGLVLDGATGCVGLLVVVLTTTAPVGLAPLSVLLVLLLGGSLALNRLDMRERRLQSLYRFTSAVGDIRDTDELAWTILREARDILHCDVAELRLPMPNDLPALALRVGTDGTSTVLDPVTEGDAPAEPDAMSVALLSGGKELGTLSVAARWRFLHSFSAQDLMLLRGLADHAAAALHGTLLLDQVRREAAEREHQALHDSVTQLPNRRALGETAQRWALEHDEGFAVLSLDLLGFGGINDALGQDTGDLLLHEVGRRLLWNSAAGHVARLGNDEFAVLVPDVATLREATLAARGVLRPLAEPFALHGLTLEVRVNAGLALGTAGSGDPQALLQKADIALAVAKRDDVELHLYDLADDARGARRLQLVSDLRLAVAAATLEVFYQPKLDPRTGRVTGAEALARWQHPAEGFVPPDEFIPLAEHAGLIRALTSSVLRTALNACAGWRADGHDLTIAVNLSPRMLVDEHLPEQIEAALFEAGLPPEVLVLEITESAVMSDVQIARRVLETLRLMGVSLSLDDYGTGHSSLSYLATLPVNEIKLDKSFTLGLPYEPAALAIVRSTIALGHELGLTVVAEGVEEDGARALLADWECDVVQGYYYSRPLPASGFLAWLDAHADAVAAISR
ncbi:diguanylate cyclase (GGDEF)-like protein [Motilibacter peucedani]|uniref:Diguanylate cyclase (GGDEF)-like protein n=1 Tax=Motilibacter peucedani TaxID=598650 RepID=A0A420XLH5_9ACTN|nr:bifunctional diguanylate cyclase/phosphodiesterase [Motilibacter peucedani]RKS69386.1 diguanylate cyclase (GGDEF)-like protein [Motilibacter peucedani]